MQEASLKQEERTSGQVSLFGERRPTMRARRHHAPITLPNLAPMTDTERLAKEKEILGFYISGHPLEPFRTECELFATHTVAQLGTWTDRADGARAWWSPRSSGRSASAPARSSPGLTIEDFSGSSEVLVFPEAWALLADRIRTDVPVLIEGGYSRRDQGADDPAFIVESVTPFAELRGDGQRRDCARAGRQRIGGARRRAARRARDRRGSSRARRPLEVRWSDGNGADARFRSRSLKLAATNAALTELRALLGDERVRLVRGS